MKKALCLLLSLCFLLSFAACGQDQGKTSDAQETSVTIDYGTSKLYSKEEMDAAISVIQKEFKTWEGCEMHSIRYAGDDCNNDSNLEWVNSLNENGNYTQYIEFHSDFHSPKEGGDAWEPDYEYKNWEWCLARSDGGDWELVSWGYC